MRRLAVLLVMAMGCTQPAAPPRVDAAGVVDDEHAPPTGPSTVIRGVMKRAKERDVRERQTALRELEKALRSDGGALR